MAGIKSGKKGKRKKGGSKKSKELDQRVFLRLTDLIGREKKISRNKNRDLSLPFFNRIKE